MLGYIQRPYLECFETLAPLRDGTFKDLRWMKVRSEIIKTELRFLKLPLPHHRSH